MISMRNRGALFASALALTACSGSGGHRTAPAVSHPLTPSSAAYGTTASRAQGNITGHLLAVGGVAATSRPLSGKVELIGPNAAWRDIAVQADGAFRFTTAPGTYGLTGTSPLYNRGHALCRALQPVSVSGGETVKADVLCQER